MKLRNKKAQKWSTLTIWISSFPVFFFEFFLLRIWLMIPYMNSLNSHWAPFQTYLNKLNWTAIYNVRSWLNQLRSMAHIEHGPCWFPCQKKSSFNIVTHATCDKKNIQKISLGKYMILTTLATWSTLHTAHGSHHPKRGGSNFLVTQKIMSPVWWWFVILQGFFFLYYHYELRVHRCRVTVSIHLCPHSIWIQI